MHILATWNLAGWKLSRINANNFTCCRKTVILETQGRNFFLFFPKTRQLPRVCKSSTMQKCLLHCSSFSSYFSVPPSLPPCGSRTPLHLWQKRKLALISRSQLPRSTILSFFRICLSSFPLTVERYAGLLMCMCFYLWKTEGDSERCKKLEQWFHQI